ncbi:hypothetical protein GCM10027074_45220 [Streptomyces deserti]
MPGCGADPGTGLCGATEQATVVGLGEALRGVEQRFVEHGRAPPMAGVRYDVSVTTVSVAPVVYAPGAGPDGFAPGA